MDGVERQARNPDRPASRVPVHTVSQYRVPKGGQMNPDLVGSAGSRLSLHQGCSAETNHGADEGDGRPAAPIRGEGRPCSSRPRSADGRLHQDIPVHITDNQGSITAAYGVGSELALKVARRHGSACQQQHSRRVTIQPVDYKGWDGPLGEAGEGRCGAAERRVTFLVGGWVDEKPGRLVRNQKLVIDEEQRQRGDADLGAKPGKVGIDGDQDVAGEDVSRVRHNLSIDQDVAGLHVPAGPGVRAAQAFLDGAGKPAGGARSGHPGRVLQIRLVGAGNA